MLVIHSGRKTSRTTALIELCHEAESRGEISYIVCGTHEQAYMISQKAQEMGKPVPFPITFDEFMNRKYYGNSISNFFIDNCDHLLQQLTPVKIAAVVFEKKDDTEV